LTAGRALLDRARGEVTASVDAGAIDLALSLGIPALKVDLG
jgi:hypothetical protein